MKAERLLVWLKVNVNYTVDMMFEAAATALCQTSLLSSTILYSNHNYTLCIF